MAAIKCAASGCGKTEKSGKIFSSAVIVDVSGAVTTDIKEKSALDVKKAFSSVNDEFHPVLRFDANYGPLENVVRGGPKRGFPVIFFRRINAVAVAKKCSKHRGAISCPSCGFSKST